MNFISEYIEQAEQAIADFIEKEGTLVEAEQLGLDSRASYGKLVVVGDIYTDGAIIAQNNNDARVLNYYGGFEYIDDEHVTVVGKYTIYSADASRVEGAMENLIGERMD